MNTISQRILFGTLLVVSHAIGANPVFSGPWQAVVDDDAQQRRQSQQQTLNLFETTRRQMGTRCRLLVYARDKQTANRACEQAFAEMQRLNQILSDYEADSEIRLLSAAPVGTPVKLSDELFQVLRYSQSLAGRTDGAFDITVGPFVRLWRRIRKTRRLPVDDDLKKARQRVGFRRLSIDESCKTVTLNVANVELDVGGVAKGYIADAALNVLRRAGISRALIDAGGDIVVGDAPPGRSSWRIAVQDLKGRKPDSAAAKGSSDAEPQILRLVNQAAATSGDLFQFVRIDGKRYSHIIDPKTGLGLTHRSSVTVVAKTGMQADGLASAVSVLGANRGIALIEDIPQAEAFVAEIRQTESSARNQNEAVPVRKASSGFRALIKNPSTESKP